MSRVTFSTPRGCFRPVGIVFAGIGGTLLAAIIVGLTSGREREPVEYIVLVFMAIFAAGLMMLGIAVPLLRRECTIDRDAGTVESGWYLIRPLLVRHERLSAFGAVTLTSGVSRRTDASGRMSNMPDRVSFKVCLIRGNRDEAASLACSVADILSSGRGVHVLPDGREIHRSSPDLSKSEWQRAVERLLIVKSISEDVEAARRTAAEVATLTGLPFGHPTLGPDAPDPAMQPLDLDPSLCLSCDEGSPRWASCSTPGEDPIRVGPSRRQLIFPLGLSGMLLLLGLFSGILCGLDLRKQHLMMKTYRPVEATVFSTKVELIRSKPGSSSTSYRPVVEYRYEVNDSSYTNTKVFPSDFGLTKKWARNFIDQYKAGQTVEAYYNPEDPSVAFLVKRQNIITLIFVTLSPVLLILSFLAFKFRARLAK